MVRAAVYARISSDDGTALGVTRQVKDCRKVAEDLGWEVVEEYVDNDVSAYSGKRRPAYERMLGDLADGHCDGVIVYHADRLTRRPIELEQFLDVVTRAGVRHVRFVAGGELDVTNGDGLLMLRMLGAVAANESATKSRRLKRKLLELAEAGKPTGGGRSFGFDNTHLVVRPDEAEAIRTVVDRYLAGESMGSLTKWLTAEGVPTVTGKQWRTQTLRTIIRSGAIAGLMEFKGEIIGPAVWPPIITPAQRDKVLALMESRKASGRRAPRRYLLSSLLRCGKCNETLRTASRVDRRRYVCVAGPDHDGCGGIMVTAPPLEELITEAVLYRLDTPELADALRGRSNDDSLAIKLSDAIAADRAQLDELAQLYAEKAIPAREWVAARRPIEDRVTGTERRLARLARTDSLAGLVGNGAELRASWADLNLDRQAAIVGAVLDHAIIGPAVVSGLQKLDPNRVEPIWRL